MKNKPKGYWTKERCREESLKYKTQKEFKENCSGAYNITYYNGWMFELCSHMICKKKPNGYWTKEKCHNEALKYETRTDFQKYSGSAICSAFKNGWLDDICSHMKILMYPKEYWTKEKCHELALKCENRMEFRNKYDTAHRYSCENNWMDEICSHMKSTNLKNRCIYVYEFPDKSAYIGLTHKLKERHNRHLTDKKCTVYIYINKSELIPNLIQLTDYINIEEARFKEGEYVEKYKQDGWKILNKVKTGSIGGITMYWTKEKCQEVALKCRTKSELDEKYHSAYDSARKNNWIDDICSHMENKRKESGYWNNYENCLNEAIYRRTRTKFRNEGSGAFNSSVKNGWIKKIYSYMNWYFKHNR